MMALAAAEGKLTEALSSVPDHARAHLYLGHVHILTRRAAEGIAECEHALELDRNLAEAHSFIGVGKLFVGHAEETEAHIAEALRLSPRDTLAYRWMNIAGAAKDLLGNWEQAVVMASALDRDQPKSPLRKFYPCRRLGAAWPPGRGAFRCQSRPRTRPDVHRFPLPRRLDGDERQSDVSGPTCPRS